MDATTSAQLIVILEDFTELFNLFTGAVLIALGLMVFLFVISLFKR